MSTTVVEHGHDLLMFLLPVIILLVGFAIDYAHMQRVRTEMRMATDLAAKAA